jgi:NADH-quinone oxidoreductase subunit L
MWSKALWAVAALTALLTAVYMTRMMVMTFWGSERFREAHEDDNDAAAHFKDNAHHVHEPHESPWVMTAPLIVLAILSTFGGLIGVPYALSSLFGGHPENYIERTLEPAVAKAPGGAAEAAEHGAAPQWLSPKPQPVDGPPAFTSLDEHAGGEAHSPEEIREVRLLALLSVLIALTGIGAGWMIFRKRPLLKLPRILEKKYYVDEIYDAAIINPIKVGSREGLWKLFDVGVIDGFLHSLGDAVTETGKVVRHLQAGFVRGYAAIILLGALAVVAVFAYYGVHALRP